MYLLPAFVIASQFGVFFFFQFITMDSLFEQKKIILHECSFLLNLLNELMKSDIMQGLSTILSLFANCLINSVSHEHKC